MLKIRSLETHNLRIARESRLALDAAAAPSGLAVRVERAPRDRVRHYDGRYLRTAQHHTRHESQISITARIAATLNPHGAHEPRHDVLVATPCVAPATGPSQLCVP